MNNLHALALELAPELRGRVEVIEHPADAPAPKDCFAYTSLGRNLAIRAELKRLDRWPGAYPATIAFVAPLPPEAELFGLLAHELAHCLPAREMLSNLEPTQEQAIQQAESILAWANRTEPVEGPPWKDHDARWIRRVVHLNYRAERAGIDIRPKYLHAAGFEYGLSHISNYAAALSCEPAQSLCSTFAQIEKRPMPLRFAELFAHDVGQFHHDTTLDSLETT